MRIGNVLQIEKSINRVIHLQPSGDMFHGKITYRNDFFATPMTYIQLSFTDKLEK